ncbi:MAG: hypothetical protein V1770_00795 [bacterium]
MSENEKNNLLNDSSDRKTKNVSILEKIKNFGQNKSEDMDNSEKIADVNFIASNFVMSEKEITRKFTILAIILLINICTIALIYAALLAKEKISYNSFRNLEAKKAEIESQIEALREDEAKIIKVENDISLADSLLDNHIYWDNFFKVIEEHTVLGVRYETFNIDNTGQLKLDALAENFDALSQQLSVFDKSKDYFSDVEMSSISINQDKKTGKISGIRFFISLNVNKDVFYRNE